MAVSAVTTITVAACISSGGGSDCSSISCCSYGGNIKTVSQVFEEFSRLAD